MIEKPTAVIIDMDGTLCDTSSILWHINLDDPRNPGRKDFDAFHAASIDCPPNVEAIRQYNRALEEGHRILIVTGRLEKWRFHSILWLHENTLDRYHELHMRPDGDFRPDYVIKGEILDRLQLKYEIVRAIDDNPRIIELWESHGIETVVIPGWDMNDFSTRRKRS